MGGALRLSILCVAPAPSQQGSSQTSLACLSIVIQISTQPVTPETFSKSPVQNSLPVTNIILFKSSQHFRFLVFCYLFAVYLPQQE